MVSNVNGSPQNVALDPVAPRPVDPGEEVAQRERQREAIDNDDAVRRTRETDAPHPEDERTKGGVDRYA